MSIIRVVVDHLVVRHQVPGHVWRQGEFKWKMHDVNGLTVDQQMKSIDDWIADNVSSQHFLVTSYSELKANYFAARLVEIHLHQNRHAEVMWVPIYDSPVDEHYGHFRDATTVKQRETEPTLLVLSGLDQKSTNVQVEKARDVLARWPTVPTVITAHGRDIDPIQLAHYLMVPAHRAVHINPYREDVNV